MSSSRIEPDSLSKMPPELIKNVVSRLDLQSCRDLKAAVAETKEKPQYHGNISKECDYRLSVTRYLENNFGHADELLEMLSKSFGYISGSRSLEFFLPGSATEESNWDFYSGNYAGFSFMLRKLEGLGVTWKTVEEKVTDCLRDPSTSIMVGFNQLRRLIDSGELHEIASNNSLTFTGKDDVCMNKYNFTAITVVDGRVKVSLCDFTNKTHRDRNYCAFAEGVRYFKGKSTKIQLMCYGGNAIIGCPLAIFRFHSSCVQSFIGPYICAHLYGKESFSKISRPWFSWGDVCTRTGVKHNISSVGSCKSCPRGGCITSKYINRGFRYYKSKKEDAVTRSGSDDKVVLCDIDIHTNAPANVIELYKKHYYEMKWTERHEHDVEWTEVNPDPLIRLSEQMCLTYPDLEKYSHWFKSDDPAADKQYFTKYCLMDNPNTELTL